MAKIKNTKPQIIKNNFLESLILLLVTIAFLASGIGCSNRGSQSKAVPSISPTALPDSAESSKTSQNPLLKKYRGLGLESFPDNAQEDVIRRLEAYENNVHELDDIIARIKSVPGTKEELYAKIYSADELKTIRQTIRSLKNSFVNNGGKFYYRCSENLNLDRFPEECKSNIDICYDEVGYKTFYKALEKDKFARMFATAKQVEINPGIVGIASVPYYPKRVVRNIYTIIEIGSGTGPEVFLDANVGDIVGLVDIDPKSVAFLCTMVAHYDKLYPKRHFNDRIFVVRNTMESPCLPKNIADVITFSSVHSWINAKPRSNGGPNMSDKDFMKGKKIFFNQIIDSLKVGGRFVIADAYKIDYTTEEVIDQFDKLFGDRIKLVKKNTSNCCFLVYEKLK